LGAKTNKVSKDFYQISILPFAAIIIKICRAYTNSQEDFEDYYQEGLSANLEKQRIIFGSNANGQHGFIVFL
jgi:hypothetical protein